MIKNEEYLFCSAKSRPNLCLSKTNLCCFNCKYLDSCFALHKNNNEKILPCSKQILYKNEICEFMI